MVIDNLQVAFEQIELSLGAINSFIHGNSGIHWRHQFKGKMDCKEINCHKMAKRRKNSDSGKCQVND
jgi:hypothetical protein